MDTPEPGRWLVDKIEAAIAEMDTAAHWRRSARRDRELAARLRAAGRELCAAHWERIADQMDEIADGKEM